MKRMNKSRCNVNWKTTTISYIISYCCHITTGSDNGFTLASCKAIYLNQCRQQQRRLSLYHGGLGWSAGATASRIPMGFHRELCWALGHSGIITRHTHIKQMVSEQELRLLVRQQHEVAVEVMLGTLYLKGAVVLIDVLSLESLLNYCDNFYLQITDIMLWALYHQLFMKGFHNIFRIYHRLTTMSISDHAFISTLSLFIIQ